MVERPVYYPAAPTYTPPAYAPTPAPTYAAYPTPTPPSAAPPSTGLFLAFLFGAAFGFVIGYWLVKKGYI